MSAPPPTGWGIVLISVGVVLLLAAPTAAMAAWRPSAANPPARGDGPTVAGLRTPAAPSAVATWSSYPTGPKFPGLFYPSLSPDLGDNLTVLFGGCTNVLCPQGASNATWLFQDKAWSELYPQISPPPRGEAQMAWDPFDGYVLLYGGDGCADPPACKYNAPLSDTWAFGGGIWTKIATRGNPPPTDQGALAYDPSTHHMILFGGYACYANCTTWEYSAGDWVPLNLSTAPSYRYGEGFADDDADNGALLFGGINAATGGYLSDTWLFSGGTWHSTSPATAPPQREFPQMAWDPSLNSVILNGGNYVTLSNFPGVTYSDTWSYASGGWSQLAPGTSPPGRSDGAAAADPETGQIVLLGGCGPSGCPFTDTWGLGPTYNVVISSPQSHCASYVLEGSAHAVANASVTLQAGTYLFNASACAGSNLTYVNATGGVVVAPANTAATLWNGTLSVSGTGGVIVTTANITPAKRPTGNNGGGSSGSSSSSPGLTLYLELAVIGIAVIGGLVLALTFLQRGRRPPMRRASPPYPVSPPAPPPS